MKEAKKCGFGLKLGKVAFWAATAISSNSPAQSIPTQAERAAQFREQRGMNAALGAQRRTHVVGELVVRPTIVQAPAGTTVVTAATIVNPGRIVDVGPGATAAQLDVRCPLAGGRVVMHGNRFLNAGDIEAAGSDSTAAQLVKRCNSPDKGSSTSQTIFQNYGRIRASDN